MFMVPLHNMYTPDFSIGICLFVRQGSLIHSVIPVISMSLSFSLSLSLSLYVSLFKLNATNIYQKASEKRFRNSVLEIGVKQEEHKSCICKNIGQGK